MLIIVAVFQCTPFSAQNIYVKESEPVTVMLFAQMHKHSIFMNSQFETLLLMAFVIAGLFQHINFITIDVNVHHKSVFVMCASVTSLQAVFIISFITFYLYQYRTTNRDIGTLSLRIILRRQFFSLHVVSHTKYEFIDQISLYTYACT